MAKQTLRVGLIGTGGIMRNAHMPGWTSAGDVEIVAACDANPTVLEKFAKDFAIKKTFADFGEMLKACPEIDAVDICTPNRAHTPAALAAFAAGKHVICEKPLAVTTAEVQQMAAAAKKAGKLLMTAQHQRWTARAVALKKLVDGGALGEPYYARIHAIRRNWLPGSPTFIDETISGGGPCMDIGVHALDLGLWLMGFPRPVRVTGTTRVNFAKGHEMPGGWGEWDRARFTVEDFASGFITFDNGATMVLESSWLQHQKEQEDFSARVFGKKATIAWPSGEYSTVVNGALVDATVQDAPGLKAAHTEEVHAFVRAVREGLPSPVPVSETLLVIGILEAIVRSGKEGREITLDLPAANLAKAPSASGKG